MKIFWDPENLWFRLELGTESFKTDLDLAKAAGFRTTGPPNWIWYTQGLKVLKALKKVHPDPIPISTEALQKYKDFQEAEDRKAETKKIVKELKAKLTVPVVEIEDEIWIRVEPKPFVRTNVYRPPAPPEIRCTFCGDPVYDYERLEPVPICLWCEKTIADLQGGDDAQA